jgi:hypothetical protein
VVLLQVKRGHHLKRVVKKRLPRRAVRKLLLLRLVQLVRNRKRQHLH